MHDFLNALRLLTILAVTALIVTFAMQNLDPVRVDFLAWSVEAPRAMALLVGVLAGAVLGLSIRRPRRR